MTAPNPLSALDALHFAGSDVSISSDPETSSITATSSAAKARTRRMGKWFDGYEAEPVKRSRRRWKYDAKAEIF